MKGYLYLIKSKGNRYKIGITNKSLAVRARTIDRSIKGSKEEIDKAVRLFNPRYYETRLHRYFKRRNFTYTGSGKTEWFRLRPWEVLQVRVIMFRYQVEQVAVIAFSLFLAYKIIVLWISKG